MIQAYLSCEDPEVPTEETSLLCFYTNQSRSIQVLRIANISYNYWERVVFPGQRLMFEAARDAKLEVYSSENFNNLLADVIPCHKLEVQDK